MLSEALLTYHRINQFLSTEYGALFTFAVESILLFLLWYMVTSEYGRERTGQLFALAIAFIILFIERALLTVGYALDIFSGWSLLRNFLDNHNGLLELIGLLFIIHAFLPRKYFRHEILITLIIVGAMSITFPGALPLYLELSKAVLLLVAGSTMLRMSRRAQKYQRQLTYAFFIYAITPITNLVNILMYGGAAGRLTILAHPFPILALLLLFRVVYLRLVDKVALQERLAKTRQLYKREQEVSALKDEFVDVVSHELRTPLTSISLYAKLLSKEKLSKKGAEMIGVIRQETKRLSALISDILDLSKLEKGNTTLRLKEVELAPLVERAAPGHLAAEKGVRLSIAMPKKEVIVDPDKFGQIVTNLYSNAVKFTPERGRVTLRARRRKKELEFTVKDTGIGIQKQKLRHLFEKFYQVDDHLTRNQEGTGLGLAIVKRLVELHRGQITVESTPKKGSTFTVRIPQE